MKKLILALLTATLLAFVGCGELRIYESEHKSEKTEIKDIGDLIFEKGASPETVAQKFNDFCVFKKEGIKGKTEYRAIVPGVFGKDKYETEFRFSADKELTEWVYSYYCFNSFAEGKESYNSFIERKVSEAEEVLLNYNYIYELVKAKYGDPSEENKNGGKCYAKWEIDSNRKLVINVKVELPDDKSEHGLDYNTNIDDGIYVQYTINY